MSLLAATILAATILAPAPFAAATHEVDHRITVRGSIYETDGTPRARSTISVIDPGGEMLGTTETSRSGKFQFLLHLHNEDAGRTLVLRSGELSQEFRLVFDPATTRKERIVKVAIGVLAPELRRRQAILKGAGIAGLIASTVGPAIVALTAGRRKKRRGKHGGMAACSAAARRDKQPQVVAALNPGKAVNSLKPDGTKPSSGSKRR